MSAAFADLAHAFHRLGFNVVPMGQDKVPLAKWKRWQTERQSDRDVGSMPFGRATGVAAVCGAVSAPEGLCLVNLDADEAPGEYVLLSMRGNLRLPREYPWAVHTPGRGGGWHIWAYTAEADLREELAKRGFDNASVLTAPFPGADHIELRLERVIAVLPGSAHPKGGVYSWACGNIAPPSEPPSAVSSGDLLRMARWKDKDVDGQQKAAGRSTSSAGVEGLEPWSAVVVEAHLKEWGLKILSHGTTSEFEKWALTVCPFNHEHDRGEACVQLYADGHMGASCRHATCTWGWVELRKKFDAVYRERAEWAAGRDADLAKKAAKAAADTALVGANFLDMSEDRRGRT